MVMITGITEVGKSNENGIWSEEMAVIHSQLKQHGGRDLSAVKINSSSDSGQILLNHMTMKRRKVGTPANIIKDVNCP
jgi:hypothetical protein